MGYFIIAVIVIAVLYFMFKGKNTADTSSSAGGTAPFSKRSDAPRSGDSWGDVMPDEPNQYNYPGTWMQYFDNVFAEEFPYYRIECGEAPNGRDAVYTFSKAGVVMLIVELVSDKSDPWEVRAQAVKSGIRYLRFYYDHKGWWNTRSYVTRRVKAELGE